MHAGWRPTLVDFVETAAVILEADAESIRRLPGLNLAESALAAPFAGFAGEDAYVIRHTPGRGEAIAARMHKHADHHPDDVPHALELLARDFEDPTALGPSRAADFMLTDPERATTTRLMPTGSSTISCAHTWCGELNASSDANLYRCCLQTRGPTSWSFRPLGYTMSSCSRRPDSPHTFPSGPTVSSWVLATGGLVGEVELVESRGAARRRSRRVSTRRLARDRQGL